MYLLSQFQAGHAPGHDHVAQQQIHLPLIFSPNLQSGQTIRRLQHPTTLVISSFAFILLAFERLASGQMFPLDILPAWLAQGVLWTPFPYAMYFPVSVYMGKLSGVALANGMGMQLLWVGACYTLARLVWRRGLKTYTVVGG